MTEVTRNVIEDRHRTFRPERITRPVTFWISHYATKVTRMAMRRGSKRKCLRPKGVITCRVFMSASFAGQSPVQFQDRRADGSDPAELANRKSTLLVPQCHHWLEACCPRRWD